MSVMSRLAGGLPSGKSISGLESAISEAPGRSSFSVGTRLPVVAAVEERERDRGGKRNLRVLGAVCTCVNVEIFSDVVCPWCYLGQARFRKAVEEFGGEVNIVWKPFQL